MATFITKTDELEACPYNPLHRVKKSRFQSHIIKCRENFVTQKKQLCPFNARHYIDESEFQHHLTVCPDKIAVDKKVLEDAKNSTFKGRTAVPSYFSSALPENEDDENWDDDNNDNESHYSSYYSRESSFYEVNEKRSSTPLDLRTCNSNEDLEFDKYSCVESNHEDHKASIQRSGASSELSQKPVGLSKEKLLEKSLQSLRQSGGISLGRGRGTFFRTSVGENNFVPRNSIGCGIVSSVQENRANERNNEDISVKLKELINSLPPCPPGEIRDISK